MGGSDRKRRRLRIAAGVVGFAVFVAAIWIVTSGSTLDRSETSPGGDVTGPAETGAAETLPPPARASAAPHFVRQRMCTDGAKVRLELTNFGDQIKVRFYVHRSPVGHEWHIHGRPFSTFLVNEFFDGTRVVSDSGVFVFQLRYQDLGHAGLVAKAVDGQTGQVCKASVSYG